VRKLRGRREKPLWQGIEENVLSKWYVAISSYHGGDMQGPSARRMLINGDKIFEAIAEYIKEDITPQQPSDEQIESVQLIAENQEIEYVCEGLGVVAVLLDSVFSLLSTPRGKVTDAIVSKLESQLDKLHVHWCRLGLSMTLNVHTLLNHAVSQLVQTGGFNDMGEDIIERSHQDRIRKEARLIQLRNKEMKMASQAKFQGLKLVKEIQDIQAAVASRRKRKRTSVVWLKEERGINKKEERDGRRDNVWNAT
jgi:hypothetical protein